MGRCVIDSAPYAVVRHPMYAGSLVTIAGIPRALGSWWGLIPAALLVPVLVWRLLREETFLAANLPGYDAYRGRVHYRLVPNFLVVAGVADATRERRANDCFGSNFPVGCFPESGHSARTAALPWPTLAD